MKRLLEDVEAKEREEKTNAALVVSVIVVLLVLTVGAEVIQASLLDDVEKMKSVLRVYGIVCSFILLGGILIVLVALTLEGRLMGRVPIGWLPGLVLGFILYLSSLSSRTP